MTKRSNNGGSDAVSTWERYNERRLAREREGVSIHHQGVYVAM